MKLFKTAQGPVVEFRGRSYRLAGADWDDLFTETNLTEMLERRIKDLRPLDASPSPREILAPISHQEVWAAGVTYYRSRDARMEEAKAGGGGGDFYAKVYEAERPELFFKATPHRVVGPGGKVRIRKDSKWNVPEPELTLAINSAGRIFGYTCGNDMSSRDIEGENPLYLPQAKVYDQSCALGPCVYLCSDPLPPTTAIQLDIERAGKKVFTGTTALDRLKRKPDELVEFLYRESSFPQGCYLMTGTGIVPPNEFTLAQGDLISITIESIGTLSNEVL
ncbi:MAG TPA: fumarylacetoacetate hydrolase family protein [Planctomycetota bacterium]|nr:fumarylacetoacetate hydrolase family protein [Planctomycetota bacterium]